MKLNELKIAIIEDQFQDYKALKNHFNEFGIKNIKPDITTPNSYNKYKAKLNKAIGNTPAKIKESCTQFIKKEITIENIDLFVVDYQLMTEILNNINGKNFCEQFLRQEYKHIPILFVTNTTYDGIAELKEYTDKINVGCESYNIADYVFKTKNWDNVGSKAEFNIFNERLERAIGKLIQIDSEEVVIKIVK